MLINRFTYAVALSMLLTGQVSQAGADEAFLRHYALQVRLKQDGFYTGKIDGRFGGGSKSAMAAYAAKHSLAASEDAVIEHMATTAFTRRIEPTAGMREVAEAAVKETLKDPFSAKVAIEYAMMQSGGASVCGTVNAKNSYGAYVGDQAFLVTLTPHPFDTPPFFGIATSEESGAAWFCLLGTSLLAAAD